MKKRAQSHCCRAADSIHLVSEAWVADVDWTARRMHAEAVAIAKTEPVIGIVTAQAETPDLEM